MMRVQQILIAIVFLLLASIPVFSQEKKNVGQKSEKSILTFEAFLTQVKECLPDLKKNAISLARKKNNLNTSKGSSDAVLSGSVLYNQEKQYTIGGTINMDYSRGYIYSLNADKTFTSIGTRLNAGLKYTTTRINGTMSSGEDITINQYQPAVTIGIVQPLLYNSFGVVDQYNENDARMKLKIEKVQKEVSDRSVLNYYKKLYFDWIYYGEVLNILDGTIRNMKNLENYVRRKARAGLAENDDVQKIRYSVITLQSQRREYKINYTNTVKALSEFVDVEKTSPDKNQITSFHDQAAKHEYAVIPFEKTKNGLLYKETMKNYQYNARVKDNMTMPQLNIVGSITQKGNETSAGESFNNMNDTDYYIGMEFSYPLGNHQAAGETREAELALKELEQEYESTRITYERNQSAYISSANGYQDLFSLKEQNLKALQSQYNTERRKYYQARLNLQYLIDTQNNIATERINILQVKLLIINAYFDYSDLTF